MKHVANVLLLLSSLTCASAQGRTAQPEGAKPYTPTRLEWLAVELNARMREDFGPDRDYALSFVADSKHDTIVILASYLPSVNREAMRVTINYARKAVSLLSDYRGWSSWLKVREQVEAAQQDKQ
jgi:hypothetical protein